ncbi:hypothetical protein KKF81_03615 [Candidatus Micrarchaeota archaeon]|nr:hypothetical protein [Candidatus Micrarchaeota archaeon]MBU1166012.1 hypothetical protein [Candidatus Micrarchaeota archaeon]MBU1886932.1 hypothetical protein [Candidatus Micrarchaeota archaeon]
MNTTIAIHTETREMLKYLGHKGATYDSIIRELIEIAKENKFMEGQKKILKTEKFHDVNNL